MDAHLKLRIYTLKCIKGLQVDSQHDIIQIGEPSSAVYGEYETCTRVGDTFFLLEGSTRRLTLILFNLNQNT